MAETFPMTLHLKTVRHHKLRWDMVRVFSAGPMTDQSNVAIGLDDGHSVFDRPIDPSHSSMGATTSMAPLMNGLNVVNGPIEKC